MAFLSMNAGTHFMVRRAAGTCAAAVLAASCGLAVADHGPVSEGEALAPLWVRGFSGRIDIVTLGDENQCYEGTGWDSGWSKALHDTFGTYATGLISCGENAGLGSGVGYKCGAVPQSSSPYLYSGAPQDLDRFLNASSLLAPADYLYLPAGQIAPGTVGTGLSVDADTPLGIANQLRFHYVYAEATGSGPGSFRPVIRAPGSELVVGPVTSTRTGSAGVASRAASGFLDLPAGPRDHSLTFAFARESGSQVTGPFVGYYTRVENPDAPYGASFHTLFGGVGASARDVAASLLAADDAALSLYFSKVRELQPTDKKVLVRINTGIHDQSEQLPSVGPSPVAQGNSEAAFADNVQGIINRLRAVWVINAWPADELFFLITVSHPSFIPETPLMQEYREEADHLSHDNERTATIRFQLIADPDEMISSGWFAGMGGDRDHLSAPGYDELGYRELRNLLLDYCSADFNGDGDVGTDLDIEAFFRALGGIGPGDVDIDKDEDVGTDLDIEAFFRVLGGGTCT